MRKSIAFFLILLICIIAKADGLDPFAPVYKESSLPVIECTDAALGKAIGDCVSNFAYPESWPALMVVFPDTVPAHGARPLIKVYQCIHDKDFMKGREYDRHTSKNIIGTYTTSAAGNELRVFVTGNLARRYFKDTGLKYDYVYKDGGIMRAEMQMLKLYYVKGAWAVRPRSLRYY